MIPKKLTILGHTIKIKRVKTIPKHKNCRGLWVPNKNLIYIKIEPGNIDIEEQTLWHEIVHAMLDNLSYDELSNDEGFVDRLGSVLHQVIKTIE